MPEAADALRATSFYVSAAVVIRIVCIGRTRDETLNDRFPRLPQRTWNGVAGFTYDRLEEHRRRKSDHSQWDAAGQLLWRRVSEAASADAFCSAVGPDFGVDAA